MADSIQGGLVQELEFPEQYPFNRAFSRHAI